MQKFIKGIFVNDPHENAPDFVLGQVSINREQAIQSLQELDDEWLNLDILKSKEGEVYGKLNTWKKEGQTGSVQNQPDEDITPDSIPF